MSADNYETKLAEWMAHHGVTRAVIPGTIEAADAEEIALRVADKKLKGEDYCVVCGEGPQPISGMELITRRDDPYSQYDTDEGEDPDDPNHRVRACPKCWAVEYGPQEETAKEGESREAQ